MKKRFSLNAKESLITAVAVAIAFATCAFLRMFSDAEISIPLIFVLTVLIVSRLTEGYFYGIFTSVAAVFGVNYVFTYPYFAFNFTISGYPITFLSMFVVSVITSALTTQVKQQEKLRLESEKEKLHANFLRAISHDLRTPLTSIVGSASAILENEASFTDEQRRMLLKEILGEATWLVQMVENLLSVTRMRGETAIHKTHELAEELIGGVSQKFRKRYPGIPLRVSAPDEPLFIPMDVLLIEQVLLNLLENAAVHGENLTRVDLSVVVRGDKAVFSVENDGKRIEPEIMEHILEDGYFIAGKKERTAGKRNMGLGLSLCLSIVKAHGGTVSAEDGGARGGVSFRFSLPMEERASHVSQR
jgi:two-component system sensor histidine kinase KdpD